MSNPSKHECPQTTYVADGLAETLRCAVGAGGFTNLANLVFQTLLSHRGALHVLHRRWCTSGTARDLTWPAVCSSVIGDLTDGTRWVFDRGSVIIRLSLTPDGAVAASFAATSPDLLPTAYAAALELLPIDTAEESPDESEIHVPITFWCWGGLRPAVRRELIVPAWADIADNYPATVRAQLEPLFNGFSPAGDGQLILWHGVPGTGKTHAIRALAHEWRGWCDTHYVTDTDVFFGRPAAYMRDVLLDSNEPDLDFGDDRIDDTTTPPAADRWRLLVLEDAGEFLTIEAKTEVGQGLSRLLNIVDGLLGQGLRLIVLITTNEAITRLHPAVTRPGRTAVAAEFLAMTGLEADKWLEVRGCDAGRNPPRTLAELYSIANGRQPGQADRELRIRFG